jgi:predicted nuclease of predicted toxin-antitoxin system
MGIRFFVDANLGQNLVIGLQALGYTNIEHIHDTFQEGVIDEEWLEYVGKNGYILITKDKRIRKNPKEKAALLKHKIVAFYLGGSQMGIKETSKQLINAWEKMEACAERQHKKGVAGAFIIRPKGGKIEEIPLITNEE